MSGPGAHPSEPPQWLVLCVGGERFECSRATLLAAPEESFFSGLLSGHFSVPADGVVRIDRGARAFPLVLEYLRAGGVQEMMWPEAVWASEERLLEAGAEARYYALRGLQDLVDRTLCARGWGRAAFFLADARRLPSVERVPAGTVRRPSPFFEDAADAVVRVLPGDLRCGERWLRSHFPGFERFGFRKHYSGDFVEMSGLRAVAPQAFAAVLCYELAGAGGIEAPWLLPEGEYEVPARRELRRLFEEAEALRLELATPLR
jgi:hypothetical protein